MTLEPSDFSSWFRLLLVFTAGFLFPFAVATVRHIIETVWFYVQWANEESQLNKDNNDSVQ